MSVMGEEYYDIELHDLQPISQEYNTCIQEILNFDEDISVSSHESRELVPARKTKTKEKASSGKRRRASTTVSTYQRKQRGRMDFARVRAPLGFQGLGLEENIFISVALDNLSGLLPLMSDAEVRYTLINGLTRESDTNLDSFEKLPMTIAGQIYNDEKHASEVALLWATTAHGALLSHSSNFFTYMQLADGALRECCMYPSANTARVYVLMASLYLHGHKNSAKHREYLGFAKAIISSLPTEERQHLQNSIYVEEAVVREDGFILAQAEVSGEEAEALKEKNEAMYCAFKGRLEYLKVVGNTADDSPLESVKDILPCLKYTWSRAYAATSSSSSFSKIITAAWLAYLSCIERDITECRGRVEECLKYLRNIPGVCNWDEIRHTCHSLAIAFWMFQDAASFESLREIHNSCVEEDLNLPPFEEMGMGFRCERPICREIHRRIISSKYNVTQERFYSGPPPSECHTDAEVLSEDLQDSLIQELEENFTPDSDLVDFILTSEDGTFEDISSLDDEAASVFLSSPIDEFSDAGIDSH